MSAPRDQQSPPLLMTSAKLRHRRFVELGAASGMQVRSKNATVATCGARSKRKRNAEPGPLCIGRPTLSAVGKGALEPSKRFKKYDPRKVDRRHLERDMILSARCPEQCRFQP